MGRRLAALREAVESGEIPVAQVDASVERILRAKARAGLHRIAARQPRCDFRRSSARGRTRRSRDAVSERSITLIKDDANQVPLKRAARARRCCICRSSTIRQAGGSPRRAARSSPSCGSAGRTSRRSSCRIARPRRRSSSCARWRRATTPSIASVFVRAASASGRMDLAPPLQRLLQRPRAADGDDEEAVRDVFFGNPYVAMFLPRSAGDAADLRFLRSRRSLRGAGDRRRGADRRPLPIALPGLFEQGFGLDSSRDAERVERCLLAFLTSLTL